MEQKANYLSLSDLIELVRLELVESEARRQVKGMEPLFLVKSMDIEVKVGLVGSAKANGKFDLKVLTIGGQRERQDQIVHTIKLHLESLPSQIPAKQSPESELPRGLLQSEESPVHGRSSSQ
jgi:hypothetical protein